MRLLFSKVINTMRFNDRQIYELNFKKDDHQQNMVINCTANHPFYLKHKGFTRVDMMCLNDCVINPVGQTLSVQATKKTQVLDQVYDLTIENTHTFFVGKLGAWVHNSQYSNPWDDKKYQKEFDFGSKNQPIIYIEPKKIKRIAQATEAQKKSYRESRLKLLEMALNGSGQHFEYMSNVMKKNMFNAVVDDIYSNNMRRLLSEEETLRDIIIKTAESERSSAVRQQNNPKTLANIQLRDDLREAMNIEGF